MKTDSRSGNLLQSGIIFRQPSGGAAGFSAGGRRNFSCCGSSGLADGDAPAQNRRTGTKLI